MSMHPPQVPSTPLNYAPPARNDLRQIAVRQRAIMFCILGYIVLFVLQFALPPGLRLLLAIAMIGVAITSTVFVFMLALSIYSQGVGIVMGLLTLIPLVGLIILLIVNGKATNILRTNGIRVGLLGANLSQIPTTPEIRFYPS